MTAPLVTGAQYADALRQAAHHRGVSLAKFIAPLTASPRKFMTQLTEAKAPRPLTQSRIRALLDQTTMPRPRGLVNRVEATIAPPDEPTERADERLARVDRDPCPLCAVRGDIGCRHRPWTLERRA